MDYTTGLNRIWTEDATVQRDILGDFLTNIRGLSGEPQEKLLEYIIKDKMFYVPNDIYMLDIFGEEITTYNLGLYSNGMCNLCYRLAMPVRLLDDTVVGFIGYSNKDDFDENNQAFIKYRYPPKYVLAKNRYMYVTREELINAYKEQYICIVDGLFDQKALVANGINAVSLCGSSVTEYHKLYLDSIKHKIVIADNDDAGRKMVRDLKKVWSDIVEIRQDKTKDIDGYLHTVERISELKDTVKIMKREGFLISKVLKSDRLKIRGDFTNEKVVKSEKDN